MFLSTGHLAYGEVLQNIPPYDSVSCSTNLQLIPLEKIKGNTIMQKKQWAEVLPVRKKIEIYNATEYDLEFLIQWVGAYFKLDGIKINVYSLPRKFSHDGVLLKKNDRYVIHLKKKLPHYKLIVIHEMIHLKQYEFDELEVIDETTVHYNGRRVNLNRIDYNLRPYENEAHAKDQVLLRLFNQYMKKKSKREKYENGIEPKGNEMKPPSPSIEKDCRKAPVI